MTTEEWADKLCIALSEAYATGGITAKRIIIPTLESALAERTEQCAKIAEQGIGMMIRLRDTKPPMSEAWKVDNEGITVKRIVASAIRALSHPEKR